MRRFYMLIEKTVETTVRRFILCRSITFCRIAQCDREDQCQIVSGAMELLSKLYGANLSFSFSLDLHGKKLRFLSNGIKDRRPCLHSTCNVANNI